MSASAASIAASSAFAVASDLPEELAAAVVSEQPTEASAAQVQAAQIAEVVEATLPEDLSPRPLLIAGAPDGDASLVPPPAPEPTPAVAAEPPPEPESASNAWTGIASWYGDAFAGQRTASGEVFDPNALTAAHRTLAFGTQVRVTYNATGQSVVVRITDRGPYSGGREIDLSRAAADAIGLTSSGTGKVTIEIL